MPLDVLSIAAVAAIFVFAGFIKGAIGLGLPTIATGLMGLFLLPSQAAAIVVLPALVTNVWQMLYGGHLLALLRRFWPMLSAIVVVTVMTAGAISGANVRLTVAALGVALTSYAIFALSRVRLVAPRRHEKTLGALAGILTGAISGFTGIFVVPSVPFLQASNLGKDELVQAIGLTAFTSAFALALGLGVHGGLPREAIAPAVVATLTGLAGLYLGQLIRDRMSAEAFGRWVLIGLAALGAVMVARGLR